MGPVHAGTIEPGHFRFSVVGEKVLRLEERLGYAHKGIERRFTEMPLLEAHRLAARVSGDSAAAFSWAYAQALEGLAGIEAPVRAAWLRALCLELERIAKAHGVTAHAVILAFLTREELTFAIPKASKPAHVGDNAAAGNFRLTPDEIAAIDRAFPARKRRGGLPSL